MATILGDCETQKVFNKKAVILGVYNKLLVLSSYLLPNFLIGFLTKKMLKSN